MRVIGITGSIACGKSTVSREMLRRGFPVIDGDALPGADRPRRRSRSGDPLRIRGPVYQSGRFHEPPRHGETGLCR